MGAPNSLKGFNLFVGVHSLIGVISSGTEPKLTMKTEDWQGGGMFSPAEMQFGHEKLMLEFALGGLESKILKSFGSPRIDAEGFRLVGAYQRDDGAGTDAVEITMRGRFSEADFGNMEQSKPSDHKYKVSPVYYRRTVNGQEEVLIDVFAGVFRIFGVDHMAEITSIITS